jgi:hypothetical protein
MAGGNAARKRSGRSKSLRVEIVQEVVGVIGRGQEIFFGKGQCASCHQPVEAGQVAAVLPLYGVDLLFRKHEAAGRVELMRQREE